MSVAIVTCSHMPEPDLDQDLLLSALQDAGVAPELVAWDDSTAAWSSYDLAVLRSPWNYIERLADFLTWADAVSTRTTLLNPLEVVRTNTHKGYLRDLERRGLPVVPTAWLGANEAVDLEDIMADRGWPDVVAKPAVGAGSFLTDRITDPSTESSQDLWRRLCANGEVMVQPYLTSVEDYGERAIIWIDGDLTHSVRKSPRLGDAPERVSGALEIADDERALAQAAIAQVGSDLLYARIDLIRDDRGHPLIAELELVEPSLFLLQAPTALNRLVRGIVDRV